jgi:drug/metabolite transporter (DMT)-like permease
MTRKGWLLFAAISLFWGIPYLLLKIAVQELDPAVVVFARVGIASLVLLPLAVRGKMISPLRKGWFPVMMLSLVHIAGPFLLITYGEQHIASSLTSLLIATEPLLVALLALRFDPGERVNGWRLVGLLIGLAGVATLLGLDVGGDSQKLPGAGLVLLAVVGYAIGALLIKQPVIATLPNLGVVAAECTISAVVLLPLAITRLPDRMPSLGVFACLLVLGLVCTALALLAFIALMIEVGASRGTIFTYINPAVATILGVVVLSEPLTVSTVVGFLLIVVGAWLATRRKAPVFADRESQERDVVH